MTILRNELGGFLPVLRNELGSNGGIRVAVLGEDDADGPDAFEVLGLKKVAKYPAKLFHLGKDGAGRGHISARINNIGADVQFGPAILRLQGGQKATEPQYGEQ